MNNGLAKIKNLIFMYIFDIVIYTRKVGLSQAPLVNPIIMKKYEKSTFNPTQSSGFLFAYIEILFYEIAPNLPILIYISPL